MEAQRQPGWTLMDRFYVARGWALSQARVAGVPLLVNYGIPGMLVALAGIAWYAALHLPLTIAHALNGS